MPSLTFYFVTFGLLVGAGFGLPVPEELPVIGAGVWSALPDTVVSHGIWRWLILPVCIVGVVISDGILYGIGRLYGDRLLEFRWMKKLMPPAKKAKIEDNFQKHGVKILLFARLLPGIRMPIFIMSGVMRVPLPTFILADGIYAVPGVSLLFFLSWWFGDSFKDLFEQNMAVVKPILIIGVILIIAGYMLYKFVKKPVSDGEPENLIPGFGKENVDHVAPVDGMARSISVEAVGEAVLSPLSAPPPGEIIPEVPAACENAAVPADPEKEETR